MKKALLGFGLGTLLFLAVLPFVQSQQPPPAKDDDPSAKVDKLFAKWDTKTSPGAAVLVVRDGKPIHQKAYGMAHLELGVPLALSTVFLIASLSKHFAVFCIMLLVQGGRLSLDDDVHKHIPEMPDFGKTITIRHLIHHTSGLREYLPLMTYAGWRSGDAITEADLLRVVSKQRELNFEPGAEFSYCNTGYELLGLIVKRVSGQSLRSFAKEKLFEPLGMKDTQFRDDYQMVIKNLAASYSPRPGGWQYAPVSHGLAGASNLHTTVEDLARWDENFYTMKVGGKEVLELMHEKFKLNNGKEIGYAGGLQIGKYKGLKTVDHTGSHGGFRTILLRFPEQHFSVIVLANAADVNVVLQARKIADIYLADQLVEPKKKGDLTPKVIKDDPKFSDRFLGDYLVEDTFVVSITREEGKLMVKTPLVKRQLFVLSETEFWEKDNNWRLVFSDVSADKEPKVVVRLPDADLNAKRVQKFAPNAEQLQEFAGTFYSPELETIFTFSVKDGKLQLRHRKGEVVLRPLERDGFAGDFGEYGGTINLRFTRGEGKQVREFLLSSGRVRNLRFVRAEVKIQS
jgi:CubicO group peptidase (beta-lactamase class C family)